MLFIRLVHTVRMKYLNASDRPFPFYITCVRFPFPASKQPDYKITARNTLGQTQVKETAESNSCLLTTASVLTAIYYIAVGFSLLTGRSKNF